MDSEITALVRKQRAAILAGDKATGRRLAKQWQAAAIRLARKIRALETKADLTPAELLLTEEWREVRRQLIDSYRNLYAATYDTTTTATVNGAKLGTQHAAAQANLTGITQSPISAISERVTNRNSPLRKVLEKRAGLQADNAAKLLTDSIIDGSSLADTQRVLTRQMKVDARTAQQIVRTETLRTYMEAASITYQEAGIDRWVWLSALDERTCTACAGLHGTKHRSQEVQKAHVSCRCVMVPDVDDVDVPTGETIVANMTADQQDRILGRAAGTAYRNGEVELKDLRELKRSKVWGDSFVRKPLKRALK